VGDQPNIYAAMKARQAAVAAVMETLREACLDVHGNSMGDDAEPYSSPTCGEIRTIVAEVDRLNALVEQQRKDAREAEREFQREARDIAAEASWQERQSHDGDYGSY
jgi:hypothetical protein